MYVMGECGSDGSVCMSWVSVCDEVYVYDGWVCVIGECGSEVCECGSDESVCVMGRCV